jgi:hypothetical protein
MVPVVLPFFEFPGNNFYEEDLPQLFRNIRNEELLSICELDEASCAKSLKGLFKIICVNFNTQASDSSIVGASLDVLKRCIHGSQTGRSRNLSQLGIIEEAPTNHYSTKRIFGERKGSQHDSTAHRQDSTAVVAKGSEDSALRTRDPKRLEGIVADSKVLHTRDPKRLSRLSQMTKVSRRSGNSGAADSRKFQRMHNPDASNHAPPVQCASGCGYQVTWLKKHCCRTCAIHPGNCGPECEQVSMPEAELNSYVWTKEGCAWIGADMVSDIQGGDVVDKNLWSTIAGKFDDGWPDAEAFGYIQKKIPIKKNEDVNDGESYEASVLCERPSVYSASSVLDLDLDVVTNSAPVTYSPATSPVPPDLSPDERRELLQVTTLVDLDPVIDAPPATPRINLWNGEIEDEAKFPCHSPRERTDLSTNIESNVSTIKEHTQISMDSTGKCVLHL